MKRVLIVFPNLNRFVGTTIALLNMLPNLPRVGFEYDLLLTSWLDVAHTDTFKNLWDRIPEWVNILPPLYQLSVFSDELISMLRKNGMEQAADIRIKVRELNALEGEDRFRNWEYLKQLVPEYSGYDIAVAYTEDIAFNIVCERVSAKAKICWVHQDYKKACNADVIRKKHAYWSQMDKIVCVSRQNTEVFTDCYEDLRERIVTIYNANDSEYMRKRAKEFYPPEYSEAGDCIKIFTASAIAYYKGIDYAIDSVKQLIHDGYNVKWFIAGKIVLTKRSKGFEYAQRVMDEHPEEHMKLMGEVSNPYPYFANCDIYVHPSRYEGLAVAIQEAKILCKPILVTNHSSIDETIIDGETGIVCDINAESITEKLKMMIENPGICERLSDNLKKIDYTRDMESELRQLFDL